jgi:YegS/Rv2252/BmrU family lipid kinase
MSDISTAEPQRFYIIWNPVAGTTDEATMRHIFEQYFSSEGRSYELYETAADERVESVASDAAQRDVTMVIAAGGDGTVASVAGGLIQSSMPMGIIPAGTSNTLAQELGIPTDLDAACRLLLAPHTTNTIDAMQVGERFFLLHISVGLDAIVMRDTGREAKRRFGRLAYIWTGIARMFGHQPRRFTLVIDGKRHRPRAAQVLVANGGTFGVPQLSWGQHIRPDDGHLDVCVIHARTLLDYLNILWHMVLRRQKRSRKIRYIPAYENVIVTSDNELPVQADGEILDQTPVKVRVVPDAVRIVIPLQDTLQQEQQNKENSPHADVRETVK